MALETATYIDGLVATNPAASDAISTADDHLRLIKSTVKATFPNITGPVTKTHAEINDALEKSGGTMTGSLVLSGAPTADLQAATKAYVDTTVTAATGSLGTMSSQNANAVAITGGSISGTTVTGTTAAAGTSNTNVATNAYVRQEINAIPYASQTTKGLVRAYVSGTSLYLFTQD